MKIEYSGNRISLDTNIFTVDWPIRIAHESNQMILVLYDPNLYLRNPAAKERERELGRAIRNLVAFTSDGTLLWEAQFPTSNDYYIEVNPLDLLTVDSFSGYRCNIDPSSGRIISKIFHR